MANGTSTIKATTNRLLREMARLPIGELDRLAAHLLVLRSGKHNQAVPQREADLLMIINRSRPAKARARYRELCARRRAGSLTRSEHRELLQLTDETERANALRAKSLVALAALRKTTVPELMQSLGITTLADA